MKRVDKIDAMIDEMAARKTVIEYIEQQMRYITQYWDEESGEYKEGDESTADPSEVGRLKAFEKIADTIMAMK
jgi:hypothetical protein